MSHYTKLSLRDELIATKSCSIVGAGQAIRLSDLSLWHFASTRELSSLIDGLHA